MSDFHFVHPNLLMLIAIVVALGIFALWGLRRTAVLRKRFADATLFQQLAPRASGFRRATKLALALLALVALLVGSMDPRWGVRRESIQRRGMDVFFVLDVSRSMSAEDVAPNRLARAKQAIADAVDRLGGDRAGLISFAGDAQVESPLTLNYQSLTLSLGEVSPRTSRRGGSRLGDAIRLAADSFTDEEAGGKAIVILSDGEDQESQPAEVAATIFDEHGIRTYAVGIGDSESGARIPVYGNNRRSWLIHDGEEVITRLDPSTLEATALAGEGAFVAAGTKQFDLGEIFESVIAADQRAALEETEVKISTARFQWLAGLALLLLLGDSMLAARRRTPRTTHNERSVAA